MRRFIERALQKVEKLNVEQTRRLIGDLADESARVQIVLDSMRDGVIVTDEENRLVLTNPAIERLLPLELDEYSEQPIWTMIVNRGVADFVRTTLVCAVSATDEEFTLSGRVISCSIVPLTRAGRIEGNILQVVDITEKRVRESQLRRAESLASFTTMAAGVAHEIKNPLGSIGIHIQLIRKALATGRPNGRSSGRLNGRSSGRPNGRSSRVLNYLDVVDEEVHRLDRIIVDFLFAIRPIDLKLELRDLNEVCQELIDFVHLELEANGIEVRSTFAARLPRVNIDERYIKQVLLNIVKNAQSAMPDGGIIDIRTGLRGEMVAIGIQDNGTGMSDEVQRRIFEPYFTTRDFGSGIGMTLVYKIIEEHRGDIEIVSSEGNGATITLLLPIPQREQRLIEQGGTV